MLAEGKGIPVDLEKGMEYLTRAARQGNAVAETSLGVVKLSGEGETGSPDFLFFCPAVFTVPRS